MLICTAAAGCGGWVLAGGDPAAPDWLALNSDSGMVGAGDRALLEITSQPDQAIVFVDGHQKGKTPLALATSKAMHTLLLKHPQAVDAERQVSVSTDMGESVNMWRRRPDAVQLRRTYPGASVSDVKFLGATSAHIWVAARSAWPLRRSIE